MGSTAQIVTWVIVAPLVVASFLFWGWVVRSGDAACQRWVEQTFDVRIERGMRGHWRVVSDRSWLANLGIELFQLGFFLGAFVVWAVGLLGGVGLLALVQRVF